MTIAKGILSSEYKSCIEAPPFAKQGEPKKPCMKRRARRPLKLLTSAVGTETMTNATKDMA